MKKRRLRAALLVVVAAALTGIGYLVNRSVADRRGDAALTLGAQLLPAVAQRIQNFRRVKVENGRRVWEIRAKEARFFEETQEIVVQEPDLTFYLEDGDREAHVTGAEGRLVLDGRDLKRVTLRGGVAVRLDDLEITTDEATYDRATDLITAAALVTVRGRTIDVHARGMELAVEMRKVRLLAEVRTVVRNDAAPS